MQVLDRVLKLYTTRKAIRKNFGTTPHLTVLLTTTASGKVLPPLFIYAGDSEDAVPEPALSEDQKLWTSYQQTGYMDKEQFQQWLTHYVNYVEEERQAPESLGCSR